MHAAHPPSARHAEARPRRGRRAAVFLLALAADAALGDPPTAWHPVGWLGRLVRALEGTAPATPRTRRRYGLAVAIALPLGAAVGWALLARPRGGLPRVLLEAAALDTTVALRTLLARAGEVHDALARDDLGEARALLARHLVSRDTSALPTDEVAGAVIESVAENLGDGVVGPWLAFAAGGVPAAFAYRVANTVDSMWGYRSERYVDLGAGAARLDDLASTIPSRVAAAAIIAAAPLAGGDARGALEAWRRDRGATESPNAGHPMAAMAGALGVMLGKRDAYRLGSGRAPAVEDIARAIRIARVAAMLTAAVIALVLLREDTR